MTDRENHLLSVVSHLIHAQTEPDLRTWHLEWAGKMLMSATQGMPQDEANLIHKDFQTLLEKT